LGSTLESGAGDGFRHLRDERRLALLPAPGDQRSTPGAPFDDLVEQFARLLLPSPGASSRLAFPRIQGVTVEDGINVHYKKHTLHFQPIRRILCFGNLVTQEYHFTLLDQRVSRKRFKRSNKMCLVSSQPQSAPPFTSFVSATHSTLPRLRRPARTRPWTAAVPCRCSSARPWFGIHRHRVAWLGFKLESAKGARPLGRTARSPRFLPDGAPRI